MRRGETRKMLMQKKKVLRMFATSTDGAQPVVRAGKKNIKDHGDNQLRA